MATIDDLNRSILEMSPDEVENHIRGIRSSRRQNKNLSKDLMKISRRTSKKITTSNTKLDTKTLTKGQKEAILIMLKEESLI